MDKEHSLLERMYSSHHKAGSRLRQSFMEEQRAALFLSWIGTGKDILDLGCRDGTLTRHFVPGNRVTGGDIDVDALDHAKAEHGIEVRQVNLNSELPFPDASFDVVVLAETLEHLPYPKITLPEIYRVLRPGGAFVGNAPIAYNLKNRYRVIRGKKLDYDPTHCQYFSIDSLTALLEGYFELDEMVALKGGRWARLSMRLFARNVAFRCRKA